MISLFQDLQHIMYENEKTENSCTFSSQQILATWFRNATVTMWGINTQDRTAMAELSVAASINELSHAEQETREKLQAIVKQVKLMQKSAQTTTSKSASVQQALMKSRALRKTLTSLALKKNGMENHLEKLRQSKINQSMISSMQATNDALAKLGVNVSDADDVMLDYEDLSKDVHDTTSALSSFQEPGAVYDEDELEQELQMMLGDESEALLFTKVTSQPKPNAVTESQSVELELVSGKIESEAQDNDPPDDNVGAAGVVMEAQLKPAPNIVKQKKKVRHTLQSVDDVHKMTSQLQSEPEPPKPVPA